MVTNDSVLVTIGYHHTTDGYRTVTMVTNDSVFVTIGNRHVNESYQTATMVTSDSVLVTVGYQLVNQRQDPWKDAQKIVHIHRQYPLDDDFEMCCQINDFDPIQRLHP